MKKIIVSALTVFGIGAFLLVAAASSEDKEETQKKEAAKQAEIQAAPAIEVTAAQLCEDYKANEIAADEKYKGKILQVTGKVDSIAKDILDSIYVTLKSGKRFDLMSVQAFFPDSVTAQAAALSKGQKVTVKGRCEGKLMNIIIKDCVLQ